MNPAVRHQLSHLDRSLLALLNERVRLLRGVEDEALEPAIEDLLRRSTGPFPPDALREVFRAVARGCRIPESAS